jgi:hypothetical protein
VAICHYWTVNSPVMDAIIKEEIKAIE